MDLDQEPQDYQQIDDEDEENFDDRKGTIGNDTKNKIKPKSIVRNPRNILRVDHLVSRRGIAMLPEVIGKTKFKGKGHELEDLKLLLFKTKHWAHRLFPGLMFEDFVAKTEHLGSKRTVKTFLHKIRTNQPLYYGDEIVRSDGSDDEQNLNDLIANEKSASPKTNDFDLLFKDEIEKFNEKFDNDLDDFRENKTNESERKNVSSDENEII
ncbi:TIMELESS-interacting protein [Sarcoptes scabiei]|uniref:TIMELESS-interacting protein n=1 Tax=Sarcoptes scabiei TaxID=52283 RepID=A0A131ZWL7_SARSC|nr:TIMELESS-interacting protein [Sarcoptes scabiei]KPM03268.1 hypothetical protein QR98_0016980 [Sarcoptes scabiei]